MSIDISITCIPTGLLQVNTYIITYENNAIIIDPGGNPELILPHIENSQNTLILLTHSHVDHLGALNELLEALPAAEYYAHEICAARASDPALNLSRDIVGKDYCAVAPNKTLQDREFFKHGNLEIQAIHIPGHAPGHLCYYIPDNQAIFSGDTIFAHSIGRSDLPGGDGWELVQKCRELLTFLPPEVKIYPGHGPATTAQKEQATNPFL